MSNTTFSIYQADTIKLCRTLVIKSAQCAEAINEGLVEKGIQPESEPHRWKYYLNLSGEYHATDEEMTIVSLDTLETIVFNKVNLNKHKTTKKEYSLLSTYYEELVARYPHQEELIRGIINPTDLMTAVDAKDYTILNWDSTRIEAQEENLIRELQQFIYALAFRYHVDGYNITDEYYQHAFLDQLYSKLPAKIMAIRQKNTHTEMVHTYHIWSYLASHSALDDFREYLTFRQALWLYRNIRYLEANVGKKETFDMLVQHMLTERGLSLYGYNAEHNNEDLEANGRPAAKMRRKMLNKNYGEDLIRTVDDVLGLELELGSWNPTNRVSDNITITDMVETSPADYLPTRVLESEATDDSGSLPYSLADILITEWIRWASTGRYSTNLTIPNPYNNETMLLTAKDAVIAYFYCFNKAHGHTLVYMPDVFCHHSLRLENYTLDDVTSKLRKGYYDEEVIEALVEATPNIGYYTNPEDFYLACQDIFECFKTQRHIIANEDHRQRTVEYRKATTWTFCDYMATFQDVNILDWMESKGLSLQELTADDAEILAGQILAKATGTDLHATQSLRDLQAAMLGVLRRLTSYDLQWIQTTNELEVKKTDWPAIRVGDMNAKTHGKVIEDATLDRIKVKAKGSQHIGKHELVSFATMSVPSKSYGYAKCDVGLTAKVQTNSTTIITGTSAPVGAKVVEE